MKKFIAYFRVSTKKQGKSGLGLQAQKSMVDNFINENDQIIAEFTDIESGKNNLRQNLMEAIKLSKKTGATLLIAKLDRLSRNASFIFALRDSEVDFICCDLPEANTLTIGIFAIMAQHEREVISTRIKDAFKAKRARGEKLGNPDAWTKESRRKAILTKKRNAANDPMNKKVVSAIKDIKELAAYRGEVLTKEAIADKLNSYGLTTTRGKRFDRGNVRYLLAKVG